MKIILLFVAAVSIAGCSTPFDEYHRPSGAVIVERSVNPVPKQVIEPVIRKTDVEKEVQTFPIDLDRN